MSSGMDDQPYVRSASSLSVPYRFGDATVMGKAFELEFTAHMQVERRGYTTSPAKPDGTGIVAAGGIVVVVIYATQPYNVIIIRRQHLSSVQNRSVSNHRSLWAMRMTSTAILPALLP